MYDQKGSAATDVTITENMLVYDKIVRAGNERDVTVNVFTRAWLLGEHDRLSRESVQIVETLKEKHSPCYGYPDSLRI